MADVSRYSLLDGPVNEPGRCWVSGRTDGPVVDTGVQVQFAQRGRLYLHVDVIRELAEIAGLLDGSPQSSDTVIVHAAQEYNRGYSDAVRENIGGDLREIADRLGAVAGWLNSIEPVAGAEDAPAVAGEFREVDGPIDIGKSVSVGDDEFGTPLVVDSVESFLGVRLEGVDITAALVVAAGGQGDGAARDEGSDLVPAGSGDDARYRI